MVRPLHIGHTFLMLSARRTFTAGLAMIGLVLVSSAAAPAPAQAQTVKTEVASDAGARAALLAERQRVRGELEQANKEIDALKRSGRGLRDDYRLRARLADAEALARRLTALDTRLGSSPGALPSWPTSSAEPRALPTDGPAELEAKADILNDQARRLAARGDALLVRAHDLRARQNLRRRVGQMERDPFAPLEGSKRRTVTSGTSASLSGGPAVSGGPPPSGGSAPSGSGTSQETKGNPTAPTTADSALPGLGAPSAAPGTGSSGVSSPRGVSTPTGTSSEGVALSAQLRNLLDPTTLAELQRLESTGGATNGYEALERAAAALKARAERLGQQATELRARAR